MTSAFSWKNSISLFPASFCTPRPNLPVTPSVSWLPTFGFQSPIMKRISFLGVSSRKSCRSSYNPSTSSALLVRAQNWITVILNSLPWKRTDHSVLFQIASKSWISDSSVDYDGYSISSKGFLPTVADIMIISSPLPTRTSTGDTQTQSVTVSVGSLGPGVHKVCLNPLRVSKMDRSWWTVLTKHGPLEKGMANHFSFLALRIPWTVWKGKKIGHWKINFDELS